MTAIEKNGKKERKRKKLSDRRKKIAQITPQEWNFKATTTVPRMDGGYACVYK